MSEEELTKEEEKKKKAESYAEAQRRKKEKKAELAAKSQKGARGGASDQPEFTKMDIRVGEITKVRAVNLSCCIVHERSAGMSANAACLTDRFGFIQRPTSSFARRLTLERRRVRDRLRRA